MIIRMDQGGYIETENDPAITQTFIVRDMGRFMAMEYAPVQAGAASRVAVILMHCDQNYMGLQMGPALARRGYTVLAAQSIESGPLEPKLRLLDGYVRYLRARPDIDKVVLMGHSGGATLMTAYQAIAENGPQIYQRPDMVYQTPLQDKLAPADGIMLIDANYGNGVMSLLSLDPAVLEEGNGMKLDPAFDIFDPANGYDKNGAHYLPEFQKRYWTAQKKRNDALIAKAQQRLVLIEAGKGCYIDDEAFPITAADQPKPNNRMLPEDLRLLSHTRGEYDLLHGDGHITHEQIRCVRTPEIDRSFSNTYGMGVNKNTVRGFLSAQAIRTTEDFAVREDGITGVEWNSSYASPIGNIEGISVPALFMGMTGSYEYLASEMIWDHAKMKDKTIAFVQGATHMFFPNREAEKTPGEFGDTENALYDYMAGWLKKFM